MLQNPSFLLVLAAWVAVAVPAAHAGAESFHPSLVAQADEPAYRDADTDGVFDTDDRDDDNDGLPDTLEGERDSDGDGVMDRIDYDSDNDGLLDSVEAASDRVGDSVADSDADGVPDYRDIDSDNDSIWDVNERGYGVPLQLGRLPGAVNAYGLAAEADGKLEDTDGDGVVDFRDLDSDNDGIPDVLEARGLDGNSDGRLDDITDNDGDGAEDNLLLTTGAWIDTDADVLPDHLDLDSDQDGIPDIRETHGEAMDLDNDGRLDAFIDDDLDGFDDNLFRSDMTLRDTDSDGTPDQVDLDSDGDGIYDLVESGGVDTHDDGVVDPLTDVDGDGVADSVDVDQTGGPDVNENGIDDDFDAQLGDAPDSDGDGIIDDTDPDVDGDGFFGLVAEGQGTPAPMPDDDGDGVANFQQYDGKIKAGVDGNGFSCSVFDVRARGSDPLPVLMILASLFVLLRARRPKEEEG